MYHQQTLLTEYSFIQPHNPDERGRFLLLWSSCEVPELEPGVFHLADRTTSADFTTVIPEFAGEIGNNKSPNRG